ncbi:NAD(P)-dependent oxidoreductase [Hoeflea sp. TYP-13]|uniref:NAD(P)-dependent oxidoreductase n=1 Tax=Hoeflea sp. TYP-13 TaxID=3230023 RepID=UPI0034C69C9C
MDGNADAGVIGLGIMGSAMAANLMKAGLCVVGYDPDEKAMRGLEEAGGTVAASACDTAATAPVVITSLPATAALRSVTKDICAKRPAGCVVIECSTLSIKDKEAARDTLAQSGIEMLDCPVSGTGAQAVTGDLVVLASGDANAVKRCRPVFDAIARETRYLGAFGNGMKMKFIANLLVSIHNTAAAEALVLAQKAGLDLQQTLEVISAGAGSSRMFEVRGPMMVEDRYTPPTMKNDVWRKDLDLISEFATGLDCPVPLFSVTDMLYAEAEALGFGKEDTAAVKRVIDRIAGIGESG